MITKLYRLIGAIEACYYVSHVEPLSAAELSVLRWLVSETFEPERTGDVSFLQGLSVVEIGPRLSVETPLSSNAVAICHAMGLAKIDRVERSLRYVVQNSMDERRLIEESLDAMTQIVYSMPLESFGEPASPEPVRVIRVLEEGEGALQALNKELGLGFDARDVSYYADLFRDKLRRNPVDVELFQIANGNSEHCRHWFFRGVQMIDGTRLPETLLDIVRAPLLALGDSDVSVLAFNDNTGAIRGHEVLAFLPERPGGPSPLIAKHGVWHITGTAETHNHPTLIAPFPGAETGSGGRIRDNSASGRGSLPLSGLAGYAIGNLHIPRYKIPGESLGGENVREHATPLRILIDGSNGISSYGNKWGEPLLGGFTRSFGQRVFGERKEFRKPVLWTGGIGRISDVHVIKQKPALGMSIVRIGGPAFRIGVGGGSASSMMQGSNSAELDFKSVQRGNPEMGNRTNRVIVACVEMGERNPIKSIHDQGAGGPSNVLTELMEPAGGRIDIRKIVLGDKSMSVLEIWSAEFQEGYGLLVETERLDDFRRICARERVNCEVVGEITGDGRVTVVDSRDGTTPVSLELKHILSELPPKTFISERSPRSPVPLRLPDDLTVRIALEKIFRLPQVGSKGFLVRKVDRSVTGRVARQQCCGPAQIPVGNVQVTADGYFDLSGAASAIGEQPIKMLIDPKAGARMAVGEMLTNMASARISGIESIRCRANWMWPAKLPGEGALLCDAATALRDVQIELGIANDGGKDSLSMAAKVNGELTKSPGELVILGYAAVPDITRAVTPDLKGPGRQTKVGFIDLGKGKDRLGGSALAQAFDQIGDMPPDLDDPKLFKAAFAAIQELVGSGLILAMHDRSDGGLITTLSEMCMAGYQGLDVEIGSGDPIARLFSEELGFVFEYRESEAERVEGVLLRHGVDFTFLGDGSVSVNKLVIRQQGSVVFEMEITELRKLWEATSDRLELEQSNPETVAAEQESYNWAASPVYSLSFVPKRTPLEHLSDDCKPKIAVVREEGTNGDREMSAAFYAAGLEPWDITMSDLLAGTVALDQFQGIVFPGGFSFMDVFDSGKGWAGAIRFNPRLSEMFQRFYNRPDTFSLGVCNGCQLMALLGWVPFKGIAEKAQPRFIHNTSGRFESRWSNVAVRQSPSVLLRGMEGSQLGVWVAHGEGKLVFPDSGVLEQVLDQNLAPLAYIASNGEPTEDYPENPNGSPEGITALCSLDGRHLAMMPHPERCFLKWQWPWMPEELQSSLDASPWLQMFQNAREWCVTHRA